MIILAEATSGGSNAALVSFLVYVLIVCVIAFVAGRVGRGKPFVGEY